MAINCPTPVKIAIIDGALIAAPESESKEFTYQVSEEVGDFDDDHEGADVVLSCIREAPSTQLSIIMCVFSQPEENDNWRRTAIFHTLTKIGDMNCKVISGQ